jgi:BirA family transcriptional regulator, biotin operon repressor / biotin---[acetyl-CoA-carboxylase] ligase
MNIDAIRRALPDRHIEYHSTIDSTMRAAAGLPTGSIVLAGEQTAGQGRHGHTWHSEPGAGIYCSIVFHPAPVLTLAIGLAAVDAITEVTGLVCDLRWPNDLMLGGKKTAGILVQLVSAAQPGVDPQFVGGAAIAGIGINVNHAAFPPGLAAEATSLRLHAGREWSREDIVIALIPAVERFAALRIEEVLDLFTHASSYASGRRVVVQQPGGDIHGVTTGLDPAGFLKVRKDDGTHTLVLAGGVRAAGA